MGIAIEMLPSLRGLFRDRIGKFKSKMLLKKTEIFMVSN
jgi:hypothetical protein